jgi:DNA helicase HerA-like ATPase
VKPTHAGLSIPFSVALARAAHARQANGTWLEPNVLRAFLSRFEVVPGRGVTVLGTLEEEAGAPRLIGQKSRLCAAQHALITGSTGAGKSFWILSTIASFLQAGLPVVVMDMKGETAALLVETLLPALAASGRPVGPVRVIRPFDKTFVPQLRVTAREPGIDPEVQALSIGTTLEEVGGERFPARMTRVARTALLLLMERSEPLPRLCDWLANPGLFAQVARSSENERIRTYAAGGLAKEIETSGEAVLARLENACFLPVVREALETPECVSFRDLLNDGISIIDLGGVPAGQERATRLFGTLLLGRLIRAALSRDVPEGAAPTVLILDEIQEVLNTETAEGLKRMLSLARFKKAFAWLVTQTTQTLSDVDPGLAQSLSANIGLEVAFRAGIKDASRVKSASAGDGSDAERRALQDRMLRLKNREFALWMRREGWPAVKVKSPLIDINALRRLADACPAEKREAIRRGVCAIPRKGGVVQPASRPAQLRIGRSKPARHDSSEPSTIPRIG